VGDTLAGDIQVEADILVEEDTQAGDILAAGDIQAARLLRMVEAGQNPVEDRVQILT